MHNGERYSCEIRRKLGLNIHPFLCYYFQVLKSDVRFYLGFKEFMKSCFLNFGANPVFVLLLRNVVVELQIQNKGKVPLMGI